MIVKTHVNLCDLVDTKRSGNLVRIFASEIELSEYTQVHEKYFNKDEAKESGLLRYLLRQIDRSQLGSRKGSRKGRTPVKAVVFR
jgi:hypothetical protein